MKVIDLHGMTIAERLLAYEEMFKDIYDTLNSGLPSDSKAVQYIEQTLSEGEKNQARINISAMSSSLKVLRYDEQPLTDLEKEQARENIDAYLLPSNGIPEGDLSENVKASLAKADTAFQLPSDVVIGKSSPTISSGTLYIKCQHVNTISASGNYYFINCSGTITVSGTSPKIYITDSPNLTVNGITSSNWRNIYIDGEASYIARSSSISVNLNSTVTVATGIQDSPDEIYEVNMSIPDNNNRILRGYGNMAYSTPNYDNSKVEYVEFKISSNNLTVKPVYGESYFLISWVKFTKRLKI